MPPIAANIQPISQKQNRHVAMMKLLRTLRKESSELMHSNEVLSALIAGTSLSHRGLLPERLNDSIVARFIKEYGKDKGMPEARLDRTSFAQCGMALFKICDTPQAQSFIEKRLGWLVKAISSVDEIAALDESLAAGWFHQCCIKASGINKNVENGHASRAQPADMPSLTQWFTPDWIAKFLVTEAIDNNPRAVFVDPACGAGHLLVPAVQTLLAEKFEEEKEEALKMIFEEQLFGLEVDERVAELARLALYFEARDQVGLIDLPIPAIHTFGDSEASRSIGSLQLGADPHQSSANRFLHSGSETPECSASRLLPSAFDAIAMNPPYLGHRTMPYSIRDFLAKHYQNSQYDLYAAFLELGLRLLKPGGRLAAICQQSVLTIQRYQPLRETIIETAHIESVAQLGAGVFATKGGEKTNTAVLTLRKRGGKVTEDVRCWQLLTSEEKSKAEATGINDLPPKLINRDDADALARALPQSPFSFWAPKEILQLFSKHAPIVEVGHDIVCTNGLFTCNNGKFVSRFDDIPQDAKHEYVPYDKGGGYKWFHTSPLMLHWKEDGREIREYRVKRGQSARMPGEQHYFAPGVTYSYIGTRGFKARLLTPNAVFDIASSAIFSSRIDILFIVGYLNSSLVRSILGVLNPTVNFQIGDIRRLPFKPPDIEIEKEVSALSARAVAIARELETFDPKSPSYAGDVTQRYGADVSKSHALHRQQCELWKQEEEAIQTQLDQIIFDLYELSSSCRSEIKADPWVSRGADAFAKSVFNTCKQPV